MRERGEGAAGKRSGLQVKKTGNVTQENAMFYKTQRLKDERELQKVSLTFHENDATRHSAPNV